MMRLIPRILCVAFLLWTPAVALPQSEISGGHLRGRVLDPTGAVLPGATITVKNLDTSIERQVTADDVGNFRFLLLQPADYEVRAQLSQFATYVRPRVPVQVGQTISLDLQMQPATLAQEIVVETTLSPLEGDRTQQSDIISQKQIQNLPMDERSVLNFALLTPGVADASGLTTFILPQVRTYSFSFLGQSVRANSVLVDGLDNNENAISSIRSVMSQEAIREFQINRSNFSSEFGHASGGIISVASKSGANQLRGSVFTYWRDEAMDARNAFAFGANGEGIDPPFTRLQSGFAVGGPVEREKSFFFLAYEGARQRESRFVSFLENKGAFQQSASQAALVQGLAASPSAAIRNAAAVLGNALTTTKTTFPNTFRVLESNSGAFPFKNNENSASLRLDRAMTSSNQVFTRLTFTDLDTAGGLTGALNGPSRGANFGVQDYGFAAGNTHFFSSRFLNEFRFQVANRDFRATPADPWGPEITVNGFASFGRSFILPAIRNEKRFQFLNNTTFIAGKHQLKFGGDFHHIPLDTRTDALLGGRFIFGDGIPLDQVIDRVVAPGTANGMRASLTAMGRADLVPNVSAPISALQAFNFGLPLIFQQGFGDGNFKLTNKFVSGYIQDDFKARHNLTLNFGLRYDTELQPSQINQDRNNFGPRFAFAYSPVDRTVVRGGYGIYYAPVFEALVFLQGVFNGEQISQILTPLTGLPAPGSTTTAAQVWAVSEQQPLTCAAVSKAAPQTCRLLTAEELLPLGLIPGVSPRVLVQVDPDLVSPYSQQFSLGVDRQISASWNLSATYLGNRGVKLLRSRNANLRQIGSNAYGPTFGPIDPGIAQRNNFESSASSIYHGLAMSATRRVADGALVMVSYTLSKAIDDSSDLVTDSQPANQLNLRGERALSSFDQRHRLVLSGVFGSPILGGDGFLRKVLANWTLSPVFTAGSGRPFNVILGFDANMDLQTFNDRPLLAGRNTGKGPSYVSLDFRLGRGVNFGSDDRYQLEGTFEVFNALNRTNFSGVNNVVGTTPLSSFDVEGNRTSPATTPLGFTSAFDPRQIQLGTKFRF
jgi:hypothetical protein